MKKLLILVLVLFSQLVFASGRTVEVIGESLIIRDDIASARIQAESRARWAAMEEVAQVKITASSIVHNAELLDEGIKSQVSGSISEFTVLEEGRDGNTYWVKARATVLPEKAKSTLGGFTLNTNIAVYMPMINGKNVQETHPFSEKLISDLIQQGFDVVDVASMVSSQVAGQLLDAAQKNDMARVRSIVSQFMAGSILVGQVRIIDNGRRDLGNNASMQMIDAEVNYRLIGEKDGQRTILTTGTAMARAQGATMDQAMVSASRSLANRDSQQIASVVSEKLMGANNRTVRVVLVGNSNMQAMRDFRDMVRNISWVLDVREVDVSTLTLTYPERTLFLATIIGKNGYRVENFTDTEIRVRVR